MTASEITNWHDLQLEILNRIQSRQWKPGELIPNEVDLASEFGCARATVNRALRAVADAGLLERRRKAGTRVAIHPVRKATLNIPIIRHEVEARNQSYTYALIGLDTKKPAAGVRARMGLDKTAAALHVRGLHLADGMPYVYEDRWVNLAAVPAIKTANLEAQSANEWLVANAPFTEGDIAFSAAKADAVVAEVMSVDLNEALFVIERSTWNNGTSITSVRLTFAAGYRMHTTL
ncbi:MAG: GntR family transcriptional regulator [Hyphomicrobiaceae bacterium]